MPMGIIPDDLFDLEIDRVSSANASLEKESDGSANASLETPDATRALINEIKRGRPEGSKEISPELREEIARHALEFGNQSALANYPISQSSVSAFKTGKTSLSAEEPDLSLLESVNKTKRKLHQKASARLDMALENVTEDKLAKANLKDLAAIMVATSAVVKNMEPEAPPIQNANNQQVNFVFFAPKVKDEAVFETINVSE